MALFAVNLCCSVSQTNGKTYRQTETRNITMNEES